MSNMLGACRVVKVDPATGHVDGRSTIRIAYDRCLDQVGFAHELGDKPGPRVAIDLVGCPELLKLAPCRVALKGEMTNPTKSMVMLCC